MLREKVSKPLVATAHYLSRQLSEGSEEPEVTLYFLDGKSQGNLTLSCACTPSNNNKEYLILFRDSGMSRAALYGMFPRLRGTHPGEYIP